MSGFSRTLSDRSEGRECSRPSLFVRTFQNPHAFPSHFPRTPGSRLTGLLVFRPECVRHVGCLTDSYNGPVSGGDKMHPTPGVKFTYADFLLFPDDGQRHELIDGEHFVTPSPNTVHQTIVGNLHFALRGYLEAHPIGQVFVAPFDVVFSDFDVVEPDLLYMTEASRRTILTKQNVRGAPDLVIEIGSPGTRRRDETIKRRLYERDGVAEYWVVDPDLEVVRIYRREQEGFGRPREMSREAGDVLQSPLFPDLTLPLETIFRIPA